LAIWIAAARHLGRARSPVSSRASSWADCSTHRDAYQRFARDRAWSAPAPRTALHRVAVVGLQHNPIIPAHYARKRAQGTAKMNARGD
jgi:hypothetical protein